MTARRDRSWVLGVALLYPTLFTWLYFVALRDSTTGLQQVVYAVGKLIQFAFPIVWIGWRRPWRLRPAWPHRQGLAIGLGFGLLVSAAMLGLYFGVIRDAAWFAAPRVVVQSKVAALGITSAGRFLALGLFYALGHSAAEEYYWRWFVYGEMRTPKRVGPAMLWSSVGFAAHHVVLLATFFGLGHPLTWLFAGAIAVGGAFWAWLYERSGQLYGPWLSHLLVDAAIFTLGYTIVAPTFD